MEIQFKNGSYIKIIENKNDSIQSKPHDFQFEDISEYIRYLKKNPSAYLEYFHGIKLYWWQKVYLDIVSLLYQPKDKAEKRYHELIKKYNLDDDLE